VTVVIPKQLVLRDKAPKEVPQSPENSQAAE
jgi:hypothetical protein